jgi:hypothetical protein
MPDSTLVDYLWCREVFEEYPDNRNYSLDARYWQNHYISRDKMVAKVFFEYFPTPKVIH